MTEEEKKEFEEFLQWKKERAAANKGTESSKINTDEGNPVDEQKVNNSCYSNNNNENLDSTPSTSAEETTPIWGIIIVLVIGFFVIFAIIANHNAYSSINKYTSAASEVEVIDTSAIDTVAAPASPQKAEKVTWYIRTEKDEMTDTKNIWAEIKSEDFICQDFPYDGLTYAYITVRYMRKYGYDVLVQISQGQINGRSYNSTNYITARFDGGTPKKYYFNEAADGSRDVVFLRNKSDFIKKCKQAKEIKIEVPIWQSGRPVFTFHVDEPLVWPKE